MYAKLEGEQQRLYEAERQKLQEEISMKSGEELAKSRLQILAGLTRLRQLCCDPRLLYEDYTSGACKVCLLYTSSTQCKGWTSGRISFRSRCFYIPVF